MCNHEKGSENDTAYNILRIEILSNKFRNERELTGGL
jgi:hypothetical protein